MKPFRDAGETSLAVLRDAGLFPNAEEFALELVQFLSNRGVGNGHEA